VSRAVPDLNYDDLDVTHCVEDGVLWDRIIRGGVDAMERERLRVVVLAYCH
jgi:hypothetical protein